MMTPEAKRCLSDTIRSLRAHLLDKLHSATERAYKFSIRARDAGLSEAAAIRRRRFESWLDEQVRAQARNGGKPRSREDFRRDVEKQAAYTLLNRLVFLRILECTGVRRPPVLISGWDSRGYGDFRELGQALVRGDDTEGYAFLLQLVFEDLAVDLPGLYGPAGMADLVPIPAATLRHVVEALDNKDLESCWTDDMAFGWVYQYWNDPEREALDAKLNARGRATAARASWKSRIGRATMGRGVRVRAGTR